MSTPPTDAERVTLAAIAAADAAEPEPDAADPDEVWGPEIGTRDEPTGRRFRG